MGLLDKKERIVDMILTQEGRRQLSLGQLEFRYFCLFDDEVDYDPYVPSTGSLTDTQLRELKTRLIEDAVVFEAFHGVVPAVARDRDNLGLPRSRIFDMPQGSDLLPRATFTPDVLSGSLEIRQAIVSADGPESLPAGVMRQTPTVFGISTDVVDGFVDSKDVGVLVRVFVSGSEGLQEVIPARDYSGDICYGLSLKALTDESDESVERKVRKFEGTVEV